VLDLCLRFNPAVLRYNQPHETETSSSRANHDRCQRGHKTEPARKQRNSLLRILLIAAVLIASACWRISTGNRSSAA